MSESEQNPYRPPDVDRCRFEKQCVTRYRLAFRLGFAISLIASPLLTIAVFTHEWWPEDAAALAFIVLSNVMFYSVLVSGCAWLLLRWHHNDVGQEEM